MIIPDNETSVDLLYYEAIARTVVRLIRKTTDEPLSVGVHGDWGAGKSSVLMMVEQTFEEDDHVLCVRFNGWLFQGFEDAKAVLIETIVDKLLEERSASAKVKDQAKKVLQRVNWMKVARKTAIYGTSIAAGVPLPEAIKDLGNVIKNVVLGADQESPDTADATHQSSADFFDDASTNNAPAHIHAFREEFVELLEQARIDKLVVLVDDLDRCLPQIAIETLEAIRLFLYVPGAAFVIAADEGMIEYAVRQHFPDLPVTSGPATYVRNYLEKLVQVPFRLPSLGYTETRIYITLLLVLGNCDEKSDTFIELLKLARDVLQRPWLRKELDRETISTSLGCIPEFIENALELSGRIAPILADGAHGNPRQIKRFINTMSLRLAIAEERGFGDEISIAVLAKIMLAERFAPELYDVLARGSVSTGKSEELLTLESLVHRNQVESSEPKSPDRASKRTTDEESLANLPNLEWAKQWAVIEPLLADKDLRPYVFVTKDRRNVFGPIESLGNLHELVEKLQGPPILVKQASAEVKKLHPGEAERVFDALKARALKEENLKNVPPGIKGLEEVAHHHRFLQHSLLSFLKDLPISKIGPWAVSGWRVAFTEADVKTDFDLLVEDWAQQNKNKELRAAAQAVSKFVNREKQK